MFQLSNLIHKSRYSDLNRLPLGKYMLIMEDITQVPWSFSLE